MVVRNAGSYLSSWRYQWIGRSLLVGAIALLSGLPLTKPAGAAERVRVTVGQLEFPLTIEDLETFAHTGDVEGSMKLYARFLDDQARTELRDFLQQSLDVDAFTVSQITYSPMIERTLRDLGTVIRTEAGLNGFYALRAALILSADDPEGLSILNVIRYFPSSSIRISAPQLLSLRNAFTEIAEYRDAALRAIDAEMEVEIANSSPFSPPAESLSAPGSYPVLFESFDLRRDRLSSRGEIVERSFRVDFYRPEGRPDPAPVVVISHGLGSGPSAFAYLAEHLASHGFAVVVPQHIGSDAARRQAAVEGLLSSDVNPVEYLDRPQDISFVLDELERRSQIDPDLQGKLDLQTVGAIGHSFGGYTVLALAGAQLSIERLQQSCAENQISFNAAPSLQCLASRLPKFNYQLRDERIKAVVAMSPITGILFGPEGMGEIQVPTMIAAGSDDIIASVVQEQIHPFIWLTTPEKYLAVSIPSSHTYADNTLEEQPIADSGSLNTVLSGPNPDIARDYMRELNLAMMQVYLQDQSEYKAYLTSAYARWLSQAEPLTLQLVRSLTPGQLQDSFGGTPPLAIVPELPTPTVSPSRNPILAEIAETGILKAAVRPDAAPFGFINAQQQLDGYCLSLLEDIADQLEVQLARPVRLDASIRSTVEDRFDLVRDRDVYVECGPNTVRDDLNGIAFSTPFFLTGTHLLAESQYQDSLNPLSTLAGISIGVLDGTTTETFLRDRYPNAQIVPFTGVTGQTDGIQAMVDGTINAFASDGVLLSAAASRLSLSPSDYTLIPDTPLTCDPYGLILPANDPEWQNTVNESISAPQFRATWEDWFTADLYPQLLFNLDYCVTVNSD